ncbi:MAG: phenylalanine--tRNA ligase subunit beta [Oscillospiraceae bacterium]|jgi:phenylalanyl-tRNA synthetase beta chain|nr:phenylalanine--tRNA ligase subunit beta [Oscillospiraceae bacterium]
MDLSRKWLAEYAEISADSKAYADRMTLSGSKVELTRELGDEIRNVVIGRVVSIERHPDSDHLWVCQVDVGQPEPVQIVTGAQNVREGDIVPAALHKSLLPDGKKIERGKLRGVKSEGMLCSLSELNLDTHDFPDAIDDGILIFTETDGVSVGDDVRTVIGADDSIVEFEITNNRPDCLSVIGLARETAATFGVPLKLHTPQVRGGAGEIRDNLAIEVRSPELCPRYTAKMVKNIKIAPSPKWLRQRLRASGVRPINNIVDITNYVMLEYGQPMHAFDYACLGGGKIVVRTAFDGETMNTLDGTPRALTPDMLVIADAEKAVGVAGVMGGENSEITENTQFAVFESANFDGVSIRKTASALGMRTDASGRFEKGLDPENTLPAVLRACELVEQLGAGEVLDGVIDIRASAFVPTTLKLQPERINALLGTDVPREFMVKTLEALDFTVDADDTVTVPSWRGDIEHYSDLAEEVARFYGYNEITPTLFDVNAAVGGFTARQTAEREAGRILRGLGYSEIYTYSFIGTADYDKIGMAQDAPERDSVTILNPLGENRAIMRTTPLPSMLDTLARNRGARNDDVRLYELAKIYCPTGDILPDERVIVTLGAYGDCDFYTVKGAIEAFLSAFRVPNPVFFVGTALPSFHTGRFAYIYSDTLDNGGKPIGLIGQIHPSVAREYDLPDCYAAEIDLADMLDAGAPEPKYAQLPRFPSVTRDIAVVCGEELSAAEIIGCVTRAGGKLLRGCKLFDVYVGAQVPQGKKSLALALEFRDDDRTLTDEEADNAVAAILAALDSEYGAGRR